MKITKETLVAGRQYMSKNFVEGKEDDPVMLFTAEDGTKLLLTQTDLDEHFIPPKPIRCWGEWWIEATNPLTLHHSDKWVDFLHEYELNEHISRTQRALRLEEWCAEQDLHDFDSALWTLLKDGTLKRRQPEPVAVSQFVTPKLARLKNNPLRGRVSQ